MSLSSLAWGQGPSAWLVMAPGLSVGQLVVNTPSGSGSPNLLLVRIDPTKYRFSILFSPPDSYSATHWRERSGAVLVCNIGQYDEVNKYLGLLVKDGVTHSPLVENQAGLFLAEPQDPALPLARVLDLRYSVFSEDRNPYLQAAQSLMLLDRYGQVRVRRSNRLAHRSLLGQDDKGNIIIIVSEGRHTLRELAEGLSGQTWMRELMCMDGGPEAQISLKLNGYSYEQHGTPQSWPDLPWPVTALPMALGVFPR